MHFQRLFTLLPPERIAFAGALPSQCLLCKAPTRGRPVCVGCHTTLRWNRHACTHCALPLEQGTPVCRACLQAPPIFTRAVCALQYITPCDTLLNRFKHDGRLECGRLLANILADHLEQQRQYQRQLAGCPHWPEVLLPVPLHWQRLRHRGFNQSLEIAKVLSRRLKLPLNNALQRTRATSSQQGLGRSIRQHNLDGAFTLSGPLSFRHLALVDDVLTTGSTANAISQLLLDHGALSIQIWAVARTPATHYDGSRHCTSM